MLVALRVAFLAAVFFVEVFFVAAFRFAGLVAVFFATVPLEAVFFVAVFFVAAFRFVGLASMAWFLGKSALAAPFGGVVVSNS